MKCLDFGFAICLFLDTQEASGSLEDLEIIQEDDMHPSIDTSLNHEEVDIEIDEPKSYIIPIRRSTKTRYAPDRMCLYIDAEEHGLEDLGEPANYKVALLDLESHKCKWLFKTKTDMDGAVQTYKARLVAKGYTQTPMIDYEETFSPIADIRAIRILIAIAVFYDYEIWQMDVKTSFRNGYLLEEVYMEQPEGFVNPKYPNRKFGFTQNHDEPCVYPKASGSNITFLILYVDDILIMGNNILMLQDVKSYHKRCFAMKDLGEAAYNLGIKVYRDRSRRLIGLCQIAYIEKILKRNHMENSKCRSIHMQDKLRLSKSQGASIPAVLKRMQNVSYASAVGSIMHAMRCTRPYVSFAKNITSQFEQNPRDLHWTTIKNILKYLRNTKDMFLFYEGYVDWKSAKQSIFATSSTEADYITAFDASKEFVWVRKFISGIGVVPTIEELIIHYLHEVIEYGDVKLEKVHTYDNLADPFTKALDFPNHSEHAKNIRMLPASSLIIHNTCIRKEFVPPLDMCRMIPWRLSRINQIIVWPNPKDVDWAGCPTTLRSTSGYFGFLSNNLISWSSKRQATLSRSSAEVEYRGVANVVAETAWVQNLLRENASLPVVYYDNLSVVYLSFNPLHHQRAKHIENDIHFVRDRVAARQVRVSCSTALSVCRYFHQRRLNGILWKVDEGLGSPWNVLECIRRCWKARKVIEALRSSRSLPE
nr:hypothetical protein [Tanacetum cinerariifolium]